MQLTPRARFGAALAYGVLAMVATFELLRDAFANKLVAALRTGTGDCVINWLGARAWQRGIDVYSPEGLRWAGLPSFGHPPTTPLWYLPFTAYGIFELNQVYGHLLILMLLVHCVLLAAELRAPVALVTGLFAFALVSDTSWWANHVAMIQISEPIAFLYLLAWLFLRRDHETLAGVMVGLALSLKLYAGLLVVMLLVGRRWRGAGAAVATYLVFAIAATWRFGFACWGEFAKMLPATQNYWTAHIRNAGVQGIVLRWWWPSCQQRGGVLPA
ncbi:MAG: Membrane protein, partial [Myxococcales bacterium]|nr:Membrane protein [Myxococcales bacterium]